jgi:hypothetical protein
MMDSGFRKWLIERGHSDLLNCSADALSDLRIEFEQEQQDSETVAKFLGADRRQLDDFACYMLGLNRRAFHQSCNVRGDQDETIFQYCWKVFFQWENWKDSNCPPVG